MNLNVDDLQNYTRSQLEIYLTFYIIVNERANTPRSIENEVLELMALAHIDLKSEYNFEPKKNGRTKLGYNLAWARTFLKQNGLIQNVKRGYWEATEFGRLNSNLINFKTKSLKKLGDEKNTFRLNTLKVDISGKTIADVNFFNSEINEDKSAYFNILLGKNSSGKSYLLRILNKIFVYLEKIKESKYRAQKLEYSKVELRYTMDSVDYGVIIGEQNRILAYRDSDEQITIYDLDIPQKIIALSYNLNDKFLPVKNDDNHFYIYKGSRKFSENFFQITIYESLKLIIKKKLNRELKTILDFLGYRNKIKLTFEEEENSGELIFNVDEPNIQLLNENDKIDSIYILDAQEDYRSLEELSSGEKQILFTFLTLLAYIESKSLIMIEEPENSLHPSWQKKIIPLLQNLTESKRWGVQVIIATHSPFITGDLKPDNSSVIISKKHEDNTTYELLEFSTYAWSLENILYQVFNMDTVRNYYIDGDIQTIINYFSEIDTESISIEEDTCKSLERVFSLENLDEEDPLKIFRDNAKKMLLTKNKVMYNKVFKK